ERLVEPRDSQVAVEKGDSYRCAGEKSFEQDERALVGRRHRRDGGELANSSEYPATVDSAAPRAPANLRSSQAGVRTRKAESPSSDSASRLLRYRAPDQYSREMTSLRIELGTVLNRRRSVP